MTTPRFLTKMSWTFLTTNPFILFITASLARVHVYWCTHSCLIPVQVLLKTKISRLLSSFTFWLHIYITPDWVKIHCFCPLSFALHFALMFYNFKVSELSLVMLSVLENICFISCICHVLQILHWFQWSSQATGKLSVHA